VWSELQEGGHERHADERHVDIGSRSRHTHHRGSRRRWILDDRARRRVGDHGQGRDRVLDHGSTLGWIGHHGEGGRVAHDGGARCGSGDDGCAGDSADAGTHDCAPSHRRAHDRPTDHGAEPDDHHGARLRRLGLLSHR
jgi:hypothetical protein